MPQNVAVRVREGEAGKKPVWFHTIRNTRGEAS